MMNLWKLFYTVFLVFFALPAIAIEEVQLEVSEERSFVERISGGVEKAIMTPKTLNFEKGLIDDFTIGFVFQGTFDSYFTENDANLKSTYPLYTEIWTRTKFENGKSEVRLSVLPSRNVDDFDKKFRAILVDVYYKRKLTDRNSVLIGHSRTPIGLDSLIGPANHLFVKRAQMTNTYGNARGMGVKFEGDYGFVDYNIGGYSSTRSMQDFGEGAETVGWVNFKPFYNQEGSVFKNLKVGSGINYGKRGGGDYTVAGVGGSWDYKKWLAVCELANANGSNGSTYSSKESQGLYTVLGYNITDKLQVLGRYDVFDPNKTKSNDIKTQYTAGLNYYVMGQRLRFSLNYMFEQNEAIKNNKNMIYFLTQVQL